MYDKTFSNENFASNSNSTSYVHIKSLCICGASYADVIQEDSSGLIVDWALLTLTNGQAWHKGNKLNQCILEHPVVKSVFEYSNLANLKEVSKV